MDVEELCEARRGEVMHSLESEQSYFVLDMVCYGEPVELLQERCDVTGRCGSGDHLLC